MLGGSFHFYSNFKSIFCKQTVKTLIRRSILLCLISLCTVCLCPTKRTQGLYGLSYHFPLTCSIFKWSLKTDFTVSSNDLWNLAGFSDTSVQLGGMVLYLGLKGHWLETQQIQCVAFLVKALYLLLSTGLTQEDKKISWYNIKIVD